MDLARKDISNKLMISGIDKKMAEFCHMPEKGHI